MRNHLILIGYRGVGKTTIAHILAEKMNRPLVSTDLEIENRLQQSIFDYIQKGGTWESFRFIETQVIIECIKNSDSVIDCGGGVVETPKNIETLRENGKVFWLTASIPKILNRLEKSVERPSLMGKSPKEEVMYLLKKRSPLYQKACHEQVSADRDNFLEICDRILKLF